jgi:hypothetical protein
MSEADTAPDSEQPAFFFSFRFLRAEGFRHILRQVTGAARSGRLDRQEFSASETIGFCHFPQLLPKLPHWQRHVRIKAVLDLIERKPCLDVPANIDDGMGMPVAATGLTLPDPHPGGKHFL